MSTSQERMAAFQAENRAKLGSKTTTPLTEQPGFSVGAPYRSLKRTIEVALAEAAAQWRTDRPLTRREKLRVSKAARTKWLQDPAVPEEIKKAYRDKRQKARAYNRAHRKVNTNSRQYRWTQAIEEARKAIDALETAKSDFESAWGSVLEIRQEFQDWYDNLNEGLQQGPTGQLLDELLNTIDDDTPEDIDSMTEAVDSAESVTLPQGFGRD